MKKTTHYGIALSLLGLSNMAFSGTMGAETDLNSQSGYFIGLGGGFNSIKLDRYLPTVDGTSNVYTAGVLTSHGAAEGPAVPFHNTQTTFTPTIQAGYFRHFQNHKTYSYGIRFQYQYLGTTSTNSNIVAPQFGEYVNVSTGAITPFTGRALIASDQNYINHLFALIPYLSTSISNTSFYLGAGPALFGTRGKIYNIVGFADINGTPTDITGFAGNIAPKSNWVAGGMAKIGTTYSFSSDWFVDINYTYAMSANYGMTYRGTFQNVLSSGNSNDGTLLGIASQNVTTQALTLSINKVFSL